jgi:hypothetical protein
MVCDDINKTVCRTDNNVTFQEESQYRALVEQWRALS